MKNSLVCSLILVFGAQSGWGQVTAPDNGHDEEIELVIDNDFVFFEDYYYTAGQDVIYRRLARPDRKFYQFWKGHGSDSAKVIVHYQAGFKIFNPYDIYSHDPSGMDRPYAGWTFGQAGVANYPTSHSGNYYAVETGIVGVKSGMEKLQLWWHKTTGYDPPSWSDQIRNEWIVNLYYSRLQNWRLAEDADIVSQSSVQTGTGGNKVSEDLTLRLIQFNPINNSAFTQSRLSWRDGKGERKEIFLFCGYGLDYVLTNVFIEGSVFKNHQSVYELAATPWVLRRNIGLMCSGRGVSFGATYTHVTREVNLGHVHDYLSLRLGVRI